MQKCQSELFLFFSKEEENLNPAGNSMNQGMLTEVGRLSTVDLLTPPFRQPILGGPSTSG